MTTALKRYPKTFFSPNERPHARARTHTHTDSFFANQLSWLLIICILIKIDEIPSVLTKYELTRLTPYSSTKTPPHFRSTNTNHHTSVVLILSQRFRSTNTNHHTSVVLILSQHFRSTNTNHHTSVVLILSQHFSSTNNSHHTSVVLTKYYTTLTNWRRASLFASLLPNP